MTRVRFPAYPYPQNAARGPSDDKEVKYVFGRPGARVGVGPAHLRPLAAHGVGCTTAGQNFETGQLSRHYLAEISLNVTLNHNQPTKLHIHSICSIDIRVKYLESLN